MALIRPWMVGRRAKRIYKILLVLFILFNAFVFLGLPPLARHIASKQASEALSRRVTIDSIFVNPYALSVTVRGIHISDRDGPGEFVSVGRVYVRASVASAWKLAPVVASAHVDDPMVRIVREDAARFNFSDLLEPKKAPQPPKPAGKPFLFSINDIQLHGGRILYEDNVSGRMHALEEIELAVPSVSNFAYYIEKDVQPHFSAKLDDSQISLDGTSRPFADSLETAVTLDLKELDLARFVPEAPMPLNFRVPSGTLSLNLSLMYIQLKSAEPALSVRGDVTLSNLEVRDLNDKPVFSLPEFKLTGFSSRPLAGQVYLKEILIREPVLNVERSREGQVNLLALIPPQAAPSTASTPSTTSTPSTAPQPPMIVEVDRIALEGGKVLFEDAAATSPFKTIVAPIDLEVRHFTTAPRKSSEYDFKMLTESDEAFSIAGDFSVAAKSLAGKLKLAGLYLPKYAPYYSGALQARLTDGRLLVAGDVAGAQERDGPAASFAGRMALEKLAVQDKAGEELVKWDALSFNGIKVAFPPATVGIEEIALDKLDARVVREKDGSVNVAQVAAPPAASTAPAPSTMSTPSTTSTTSTPPPAITIAKITLRNGRVDFQDRGVEPNFDTSLDAMDLSLTGFALDPTKQTEPGEFHFQAKLDNQAPLGFSGRLRAAAQDRLVDLTVAIHDVQLSPLTPYTDKYLGYPVTKGKLVLDVKCLIQVEKLDAKIKILLDQLTLGDRVDSPTATKLPIKFALALLRDRHNQIKLDVPPIGGTLGDPKFKVWPLVVQTLVNLVERAVTSPFAFLSGGNEELRYVEEDYGSDALTPDAARKLDEIAKLLFDRPALRMDIQAQTVQGQDDDALRKLFFDRKLKAQKLKETAGGNAAGQSPAVVAVAPEEYEKYLKLAYETEDIPDKPRNFIGVARDVPRAEMERMLLAHTAVTPDDLRRLAYNRAAKVRDCLLSAHTPDPSEKIEGARLFMIEPETVTAPGAPKPRVVFTLQLAEGGPAPTEKPFVPPPGAVAKPGAKKPAAEKPGEAPEEFHFHHPSLGPQ